MLQEVPDSIKYVVNGKQPNGHKVVNGHIPLSSASASSATTSVKAKLIESDDVSFLSVLGSVLHN